MKTAEHMVKEVTIRKAGHLLDQIYRVTNGSLQLTSQLVQSIYNEAVRLKERCVANKLPIEFGEAFDPTNNTDPILKIESICECPTSSRWVFTVCSSDTRYNEAINRYKFDLDTIPAIAKIELGLELRK